MKLRVAHLVNLIFGIFILIIGLNVLDFIFYLKGYPITTPTKIGFAAIAFFLLPKSLRTPNVLFQLWVIFIISFLIIAYPVTLFYGEVHKTVDVPLLIRSCVYNLIVTFCCYKFTLFAAQRGNFEQLMDGLLAIFIFGSFVTIFALPLGFASFQYSNIPNLISLDRMAGFYMNPNDAGYQANLTMILGISILLRSEGSIWRILFAFLGILAGIGATIASFSKSALIIFILVLGIALVIYIVSYRVMSVQTRRFGNIFFAVLFYGVLQLFILVGVFFDDLLPSQQRRIEQIGLILTGKADKGDTSNRADLAILGFQKISDRPLLGTGLGSFVHLLDAGSATGDDVGIHNVFIRVWGEGGVLCFFLFMVFWLLLAWQSLLIPIPWVRLVALSFALATVIFGLTNHNLLENNLLGAIIGFMCAFVVIHRITPVVQIDVQRNAVPL